ncbi:(2Fe-2S)-binding protein [Bacillus sp. 1P02SD]|uniref:(2Fe-2S)-binding protein n=1 Tax=Bacillus sp. 1P02SD TaxID=3132264 RepID=UPI00399FB108
MIVCRCEEVSYYEIVETVKKYDCSSRETKLRTRAGMGYCGGRTCRNMIDMIIADHTGKETPQQIQLKYQTPIRPISFGEFGGNNR